MRDSKAQIQTNTMAGFVRMCRNPDASVSLLLVSDSASYLKNISAGLQLSDASKGDFLKVSMCESILQVLNVKEPPEVDFVVFCVNQRRFDALSEVEQSFLKLDRAFLMNRICLICDNASIANSFMPKILHLKHKYQLHVLWGDLESGTAILSQRLVNLASAVCGVGSGFPIITHRSWHNVPGNSSCVDGANDSTF